MASFACLNFWASTIKVEPKRFKEHVLILTRLKTCFERIIAFHRIDFTERYDLSSHREASSPYKLEKRFKNEYAI